MHKYITVAYSLYTDNSEGVHELVEQAPVEHPFQFITELGVALETFEAKLKDLNAGDEFDFTLSVDEAYGPYEQEHVIELPKSTFMLNGRFQNDVIFEGAVKDNTSTINVLLIPLLHSLLNVYSAFFPVTY